MLLPPIYIDAALRVVTPFDAARGRLGLGFDTPQGTVRLALGFEGAASLAKLLSDYLSTSRPGVQSERSDDSPSDAGLPHDGQKVAPLATSSQACCGSAYEPKSSSDQTTCHRSVEGLSTIKNGPAGDSCRNEVGDMGDIVREQSAPPDAPEKPLSKLTTEEARDAA